MRRRALALSIVSWVCAACATPTQPGEEIARAELAVRDAETSGAQEEASADLQRARRKLELARVALDDQAFARARRLAAEATVDAQLAEAKTEAAAARSTRSELERRPIVTRP